MSPEVFATLLQDPGRVRALPGENLHELLGRVEHLRASILTRLAAPVQPEGEAAGRLLTVAELAQRLNLNERAVYRRVDKWPFTRRMGDRTLRFCEAGLEKWLQEQQR